MSKQKKSPSITRSRVQLDEMNIRKMHTDECLKYKFDLKDVESKNISMTIKNKNTLEIRAFKKVVDANGHANVKEINHEINLPEDVEIFNIKNCFDEEEGILKIEIPIKARAVKASETSDRLDCGHLPNSQDNFSKMFSKDKYLELLFDLYDFKFDNLQVYFDEVEKKKVLLVRAFKFDKQLNANRTNTRKFILPDWISDQNINILEDEANINDEIKNLLKLQFEIAE